MGNVLSTQRSPAIQSGYFKKDEKIMSRPPLPPFTREVAAEKARMAERLAMRARLVPELVCSNFAESLRFYTELLGFCVRYSRIDERFAYLERDGAELMIEQSVGKDRLWPRAELAYPFGRGINFQIQVADATRLHMAIQAAGIAIFLPLEERWYRRESDEIGVLQFAIQDPDGYLLRFSEVIGER